MVGKMYIECSVKIKIYRYGKKKAHKLKSNYTQSSFYKYRKIQNVHSDQTLQKPDLFFLSRRSKSFLDFYKPNKIFIKYVILKKY